MIQPPQIQLNDPVAYISLGLAQIGAVLERAGINVLVMNLAAERRVEKVRFPLADWYGVTCVSATYPAAKKLVSLLKGRGKTVLGGVHPTIMPEFVSADAKPDLVMTGEADFLFRDIVLGKSYEPIMHAGIICDLDTLPIPARHLFPDTDVVDLTGIHGQEKGVPSTTIMTSRGCPYFCRFCTKAHDMFRVYRFRSESLVKEELRQVMDYYGVTHVRFVDDEFTVNRGRTLKLMAAIRDLKCTFICITRADSLDPYLLKEMKLSGCTEVHIGVESGSNRLLKLMNKQTTSEVLARGVLAIKKAGIRAKVYLMYNYPGETKKDRDMTVEFVKRVKPDKFTLSRFTPLPGSEIAEKITRRGNGWFYPDEDEVYWEYRNRLTEAIKSRF